MNRLVETLALGGLALASLLVVCDSALAETPPQENCYDDGDCPNPGSPHCDIDSGICFPCVVDEHCEADHVCHQHECIPKCFSDADCDAPESYCSGEGVCLACLEDAHCPGDEPLCLSEPGVGECVECIVDEDCSGDMPWCKWNNTCVECLEHDDCPEDQHCSQNACTPDVCEPGALSCTGNQFYVLECDEWGAGTQTMEMCPNADCEDGACGEPGTTTGETTGAETSGDSETTGGSETTGDPTGDPGETGDAGATPLDGRGCSCDLGDERAPAGGLGLFLLALVGVGGIGRRARTF